MSIGHWELFGNHLLLLREREEASVMNVLVRGVYGAGASGQRYHLEQVLHIGWRNTMVLQRYKILALERSHKLRAKLLPFSVCAIGVPGEVEDGYGTSAGGRGTAAVVGLTGVPHQETGASASGNGRSARGPCAPSVHNFSKRPASLLLSLLPYPSSFARLLPPCAGACSRARVLHPYRSSEYADGRFYIVSG